MPNHYRERLRLNEDFDLAEELLPLLSGHGKRHCEAALIIAYARVADGLKDARTDHDRMLVWIGMASEALVRACFELAALSDAQIRELRLQDSLDPVRTQ